MNTASLWMHLNYFFEHKNFIKSSFIAQSAMELNAGLIPNITSLQHFINHREYSKSILIRCGLILQSFHFLITLKLLINNSDNNLFLTKYFFNKKLNMPKYKLHFRSHRLWISNHKPACFFYFLPLTHLQFVSSVFFIVTKKQ